MEIDKLKLKIQIVKVNFKDLIVVADMVLNLVARPVRISGGNFLWLSWNFE